MTYELKQIRCTNCGYRLMDGHLVNAIVSVKCKKCGTVNKIEVTPRQTR